MAREIFHTHARLSEAFFGSAQDGGCRHEADIIVTFDADGQHRAAEIPGLVDTLMNSRADFALGSRFLGRCVNLPPARRLLLKAAVWFTRLTTGLRLTDSHNGLRAMTRAAPVASTYARTGWRGDHPLQHVLACQGPKHDRCRHDRLRPVHQKAVPMIAQFILSAMLVLIFLYATVTYRQAPIVGFLSVFTVLSGLYFTWLPSHATPLATLVGIGRGVDLVLYIWMMISLIMLLNLHLKLRARMELITVLARNIAISEATRSSTGSATR